mmetsp:Transcript_1626/g.7074  ORF Transcript_1626/g.7074 Transcript_1626/m.7074 type:complete len:262 (-) Transcript_1626:581-1366(-)
MSAGTAPPRASRKLLRTTSGTGSLACAWLTTRMLIVGATSAKPSSARRWRTLPSMISDMTQRGRASAHHSLPTPKPLGVSGLFSASLEHSEDVSDTCEGLMSTSLGGLLTTSVALRSLIRIFMGSATGWPTLGRPPTRAGGRTPPLLSLRSLQSGQRKQVSGSSRMVARGLKSAQIWCTHFSQPSHCTQGSLTSSSKRRFSRPRLSWSPPSSGGSLPRATGFVRSAGSYARAAVSWSLSEPSSSLVSEAASLSLSLSLSWS